MHADDLQNEIKIEETSDVKETNDVTEETNDVTEETSDVKETSDVCEHCGLNDCEDVNEDDDDFLNDNETNNNFNDLMGSFSNIFGAMFNKNGDNELKPMNLQEMMKNLNIEDFIKNIKIPNESNIMENIFNFDDTSNNTIDDLLKNFNPDNMVDLNIINSNDELQDVNNKSNEEQFEDYL